MHILYALVISASYAYVVGFTVMSEVYYFRDYSDNMSIEADRVRVSFLLLRWNRGGLTYE